MKQTILIFLIIGLFLLISSCKEDLSFQVKLQPPINIVASTFDSTTVHLKWEKSVSENRGDFYGYHISVINPDGTVKKDTTILKGFAREVVFRGLQYTYIYRFRFISKVSTYSTDGIDSDPFLIRWSLRWIRLKPVTDLKAYSIDTSAVGLVWTKSVDESKSDFSNYLVRTLMLNKKIINEQVVPKGSDALVINSLRNGITYEFEVISKTVAEPMDYSDGAPVSITWATAWRFETEDGNPIQLYENSATNKSSGLIFYYKATKRPKTVTLTSPDKDSIDVYLKTETGSSVSIRSYRLLSPKGKETKFSTVNYDADSLSFPTSAPPDTSTYTLKEIKIDSISVTKSKIYYFKGNNKNFGRIFVERNPDNETLIWGNSPEQYIKIKISFQSAIDNIYSKQSR